MRRAPVVAATALAAALGMACYATHEYREIREAPARPDPAPDPLPVHVAMVAGELHLEPAAVDVLYDLRVRLCRDHFAVRLSRGVPGAEAIEVGIRRRPGDAPDVPVEEEKNSVDLGLGTAVPADIRLDLAAGRHRASLGGLRLAGLQVAAGSGDLEIDFASPVRQSPAAMLIEAGTGHVLVNGLGNASPGTLTVHGGSGPLDLGLTGAWSRDAAIVIDAPLADVVVRFPPGLALAIRADGREPADLTLPGFSHEPDGLWQSPGFPGTGRRIDLRLQPGIGFFEARPVAAGTAAPGPAASSLLAPRRSDITPTI
jgi:hypothetical protein